MDQTGDGGGVQVVTETGENEAPLGGDTVAAPSPPVFGNANANRTGSEANFRVSFWGSAERQMSIGESVLPYCMHVVHPSLEGVWWKEDELLHFQESPLILN